jgi:glycine/D-amino acid oxidase-like deaminating enzyme
LPQAFDLQGSAMLARRLLADPGLPVQNPTISYWQQGWGEHITNARSETLPADSDVVVIGSGITSCGVASTLLDAKHSSNAQSMRVTVLEARGVCSGATGRNGGHVKFNAVSDYAMHRAAIGHERAAEVVRFSRAHYDAIAAVAENCGAEITGELRKVVAITAYMTPALAETARRDLKLFNEAFPEYSGEYQFHGREETLKVSTRHQSQRYSCAMF